MSSKYLQCLAIVPFRSNDHKTVGQFETYRNTAEQRTVFRSPLPSHTGDVAAGSTLGADRASAAKLRSGGEHWVERGRSIPLGRPPASRGGQSRGAVSAGRAWHGGHVAGGVGEAGGEQAIAIDRVPVASNPARGPASNRPVRDLDEVADGVGGQPSRRLAVSCESCARYATIVSATSASGTIRSPEISNGGSTNETA